MIRAARFIRPWAARGWAVAALAAASMLLAPVLAAAQSESVWPVKRKLLGSDAEKAEDVSGIACSSAAGLPRSCLLIDDETQAAQIVIVREGEILAGDPVPLISDMHEGRPLEFDGEAVAYDDGYFYILGSHGHPRDRDRELDPVIDAAKIAASIRASSQIVRVRLDPAAIDAEGKMMAAPEITRSAKLRKALASHPELSPFLDKRLDENGLTLEGLAIKQGRLYLGLRGPVLSGQQKPIFSVALASVFGNSDAEVKLLPLDLGSGRGVRDLVAFENGFLVLAGPGGDQEGTYSVFLWDGSDKKRLLKDLPKYIDKNGKPTKPEALLPLDRNEDGLRVLVLFDGPKEGAPRAIRMPYP